MTNIKIRKIKASEMRKAYELVRELAIYEKAEESLTIGLEEYNKQFEEQLFDILVAEHNSSIIGMALYYPTFSTWKGKMMYLEDFVVQEAFRKSGVGQLLFDAFLEEAKTQDCKLVKWQVLDWNEPAINFYKKNNATIEDEWLSCKIFL
ncbi:MAG: GNAT family N-acetyltransferase [Saprospiraceae bacterium]|nr:GNAT family N-acetyltransferase [Saprospiraceae bacterium]